MKTNLRFVYVLKNSDQPPLYYTGLTSDPVERLKAHNQRNGHHTSGHGPWHFDVVIEFADAARAVKLERYLKSGSGNAFAMRHLR
jgi:predicted GIY-YIG superfamily endonuclease